MRSNGPQRAHDLERPRRGARVALAVGVALALAGALTAAAGCTSGFAVDGARAHARVVHQVEAGPRIPGTPGHAAIRDWIRAECERLGGRVEMQSFVDSSTGRVLPLDNLIAHWGPDAGRRLALCAHWDSRPWCDHDPDSTRRTQPLPGANDGGSGVAVLLEVAELLHRTAPRVGVDLVFFDGEDQGEASRPQDYCLGARGYAARVKPDRTAPSPITAAFVFDMVGDKDLGIHPEGNSVQRAANLAAMVVDAAHAMGATHFGSEPRWTIFDDHLPLLDAGIPAVDVIDFDYAAWHTAADLPDQVSAESLAEVARVAAWLVYRSPLAKP
jgi:glutaminyl-peptide cyclotransferase